MAVVPAIRKADKSDLAALVEIERESFTDPSWPAETFLHYDCVVAEVAGQMAGFLVSRETFPLEREILNLAVAQRFRRLGIATALLHHELYRKATLFLEVRESNLAARALYRKLGFVEVGTRPDYYRHPKERAIVMHMK
jgi:ribosomal-protein-alanine N-acetyltransferase